MYNEGITNNKRKKMKNETETVTVIFPADMLDLIQAAKDAGLLSESTEVKKVDKKN